MRMRAWKAVSLACNIQFVMPHRPGDLSRSGFFISFLTSLGVNGAMNRGCVVVVAIETCSFSLGMCLVTSCTLFSS